MKEKLFLMKLGNRIKALRKSQKISQEGLSELTDLHTTYISRIERGVINSSIVNLYKISKALNMSLDKVLRIPSKKESEKDLIIQKLVALQRKQNIKDLRYIEKSITDFIKHTKS